MRPSTPAGEIRACTRDDLPAIADLWVRVFRRKNSGPAPARLRAYCEKVLFDHPWQDSNIKSLGYFGPSGLEGFLGIVPRPMAFQGSKVTAAVATQLMFDPASDHGIAPFELMRRAHQGPQDLTFTDGANDIARRIWQRVGGSVALLFSFEWTRMLNPIRLGLERVARLQAASVQPMMRTLVDRSLAACRSLATRQTDSRRLPHADVRRRLHEEPADAATLVKQWAESPRALAPMYDKEAATWLLDQLARTPGQGDFHADLLKDDRGTVCGLWLGYARPGGKAQLIQVRARRGRVGDVFDHIFTRLRELGATEVEGQLDPDHASELSDRNCRITCGMGTLIQARRPEILHAVLRGDAALSRLDGEWWMRFPAAYG